MNMNIVEKKMMFIHVKLCKVSGAPLRIGVECLSRRANLYDQTTLCNVRKQHCTWWNVCSKCCIFFGFVVVYLFHVKITALKMETAK